MAIANNSPLLNIGMLDSKNQFYIKRDDLLAFSFGGNKVRIAEEYVKDMIAQGMDCMIGYGNVRSNLCRSLANLCRSTQYCNYVKECHIISPNDGEVSATYNSIITEKCGAQVHHCEKSNVAEIIERVMLQCEARGLKPYYINGNKFGRGNEAVPVRAGISMYNEIVKWCEEKQISFDYIFLALGTGMTYAGLLCGKKKHRRKENIIGISIARNARQEVDVIKRYLMAYASTDPMGDIEDMDVHVTDDYLCGGYGLASPEERELIDKMMISYGLPLDPTYTGKAFYGMLQYLQKHEVNDKKVLFIHTGGTPLFFDYLKQNEVASVVESKDLKKIIVFLSRIDLLLPSRLSDRVDIVQYAEKIIQHGIILAIEKNDKIVSAAMFYANDLDRKTAYLTLLGTLPEYEGHGFARTLMEAVDQKCREIGMDCIALDTDKTNNKALRLYLSLGYRLDAVDKKVHMIKELKS